VANGSESASGRGWGGDVGDTDVRIDYPSPLGRESDAAGHGARQPSGGRYQPQADEDDYLDGRVLPPHTYPPSAEDRWRDGRQDHDGYNFGQANWRERRDGEQLRLDGDRSGALPGDGYSRRLADDVGAAADGWDMPRRTSGYSPDTVGGGYGRDSDGDFRRAADGASGALWRVDSRAPSSGDGPAPGFGNYLEPSGPRSGREHIPDPDGRYGPLPDARRPEPSRPGLALPELPRSELSRPELSQPELSRPEALPELPRPEPALPELPRPEPSRLGLSSPESALPAVALPDARRPEPSWPELSLAELSRPQALPELPRPEPELPELPRPEPSRLELASSESPLPAVVRRSEQSWPELGPELPRSGYGPGQLAGFRDDPSRLLDRPMPGAEPGRHGPSGPRTDQVPSPVTTPDRTTAALGRSAEGRAEVVPGQNVAAANSANLKADRDDDTVTTPLPAILPGAISVPRPDPVEAPRGFFEPARPGSSPARPVSVTGTVEPPPVDYAAPVPPRPISPEATAKLDQLKDLYLTAEAIGEDALDKHFDQVSQRQRELIKEFFQRSDSGSPGAG
jgi:hypothetical protein